MEDGLESILPAEIEATLLSLFEKEKKENKVRASLFNLIIYTETNDRDAYLKQVTKSLIRNFPCRIILIKESSKEGDFLNTYVSSIQPDGGDHSFFCEYIEFEVSKSYKERISYLVTPHVIPNLPVYVLFSKDPTGEDTPSSLGLDTFATRIIFDSECMEHMSSFAQHVGSLHHENTSIGDLNWARFSSWRKLFINIYSNREKLKALVTCKDITITYNSHSTDTFHHNKIQATYMHSWIAGKLGWEFKTVLCDKETLTISYTSKLGNHTFHIKPSEPRENLPPGRIVSILIEKEGEATCFNREKESTHLVKINHHSNQTCEIPVLYPLSKEGSDNSITKEIYGGQTSSDFLGALDLISNWKTGIICS